MLFRCRRGSPMHWLILLFLRWVQFWRLPDTDQTRRVATRSYAEKVHRLKNAWIVVLVLLVSSGQVVLVTFGVILMTFISFMFLDEA